MPAPSTSQFRRFLLLLLLLLGSRGPLLAGPGPRYPVPDHEKPVALLNAGKETYLVTQQSVFRLEHKQFVRQYRSAAPIQRVLATDTSLWLGTGRGVVLLDRRRLSARRVALPAPADSASITALLRDATGTVWVGADGYGVFRRVGGTFEHVLQTPAINSGLATADSSVWIGTNIGLSRWQHQEWTRYNEEGVANYEIPDNIVEKLLLDNQGNLWVLMSEGISVFAGGGLGSPVQELPTVKFIGRPGNTVHSVAYVRGVGHVFATAMGLLLLPDQADQQFARFEPSTDLVENKQLLLPLTVPTAAAPTLVQVDARQRVWLASEDAVTVLTAKAFREYTHQAHPSAAL